MALSRLIPAALVCVASAATVPATATAQAGGTVTGTLTIAGKAYKLAHVHAQEQKDPFDDTKKQIRVVLSDVDVTPKVMHDHDAFLDLVNENKLHAIEFVFSPAGDPVGGEIQHDMKSHGF